MLLMGGAAVVGVVNATSLLGITLASRWKFDDTARVFPKQFFFPTWQYVFQNIDLKISQDMISLLKNLH